tara:strand:- start:392 stop:1636 length:1245 start_codon:yes stop_codon:yes gene_type:complete
MSQKKKFQQNNEVDLLELIIIIWQDKFKIILSTLITVTVVYSLQFIQKPVFKATTEIKPISTFDEINYEIYNAYINKIFLDNIVPEQIDKFSEEIILDNEKQKGTDFYKNSSAITAMLQKEAYTFKRIDKLYLENLLIDKLNERLIFRNAIKKFDLIKKEDYSDDQLYESAVKKLASSIKLLPPKVDKIGNKRKRRKNANWYIQFTTSDKQTWNNILRYVEPSTNLEIKNYLYNVFEKLILNEEKLRKYKIEDIEIRIANSLKAYDEEVAMRTTYLKEQAEIARKLKISKIGEVNTNLNMNEPYYLKGFELIEKEIELIENRTNKKAFIKDITELEREKKELLTSKDIQRLKILISNTPINNSDTFYAGTIDFESTIYENTKSKSSLLLIFGSFVGFLIGIFYVLVLRRVNISK